MENNLNTRNCDQCEAIHINGTLCHETGCSESWRDSVNDCAWCGSEFKPEERGQEFCSTGCGYDYNGIPNPDTDLIDTLADIAGGLS